MKPDSEINRSDVVSGGLAILGILGVILLSASGVCVWIVFFSPGAETPTPEVASVPDPTSTPGPAATLVLQQGELEFGKFTTEIMSGCSVRATFDLVKGGRPFTDRNGFTVQVSANGKPINFTLEVVAGRFQVDARPSDLCKNPGTLSYQVTVGTGTASRQYYVDGLEGSKGGPQASIGSVQVDAEDFPQIAAYFALTDSTGEPVRIKGLSSTQVFQDGTEVKDYTLSAVDTAADPVTVALVIDVSGSMSGTPLNAARQAASDFIKALASNDSVCLYSFSTTVKQVLKCTQDHGAGLNALNTLQATGNTALYQVISTVAQDHTSLSGRQVIIVLTDGADTASKVTLDDALEKIKQTNIPVYTIGLVNKELNSTILRQIAAATSGSYLEAPRSDALTALYAQIQGQLKNQYRISFRSIFPERKTGTISLRVSVNGAWVEANRTFFVR